MIRRVCAVLFIIIACLPPGVIRADGTQVLERDYIIVLHPPSLDFKAEEVADIYPGIRSELEEVLRRPVDFRPSILLIGEGAVFQRISGSPLIAAFAVPEKNLMVLDCSKRVKEPFSIRATVKHELCHLVLHRRIRKGLIPKWLDEGIAQWVSGGSGELIMNPKVSHLDRALLTGKVIDLGSLTRRFPGEGPRLLLAYEQSRSMVDFIVRHYGSGGLLNILDQMEKGRAADAAVSKALSISLEEMEGRWRRELEGGMTWFTYVALNIYEVLFFIGAIFLFAGFVRIILKRRADQGPVDPDSSGSD